MTLTSADGAAVTAAKGMVIGAHVPVPRGLSNLECGPAGSLAVPTVKVQIWNARRRLRSLLEEPPP